MELLFPDLAVGSFWFRLLSYFLTPNPWLEVGSGVTVSYRTVGKSIGGVRFSALKRRHPTWTLKLMRIRVSDVHDGYMGSEISEIARLQVGHFWRSGTLRRKAMVR